MFKPILGAALIAAIAVGMPVVAQGQIQPLDILAQAPSNGGISSEELQKFVETIKQLEKIESTAQQQMAQAVQEEGLTPERFLEIGNNLETGSQNTNTQISSQEQEKFKGALTKVQQIAQEAQSQKQQVLETQGFEIERFNQIVETVQKDPSLKQQVQQMLEK